jgi:DNA-binding transcriptional LysR family regulator
VNDVVSLPLCLVLPHGHRFIKDGFWPKSDFAREKWIAVQEQSGGAQELREGLMQFGVAPEFSASTNSIDAALKYVEMGLGIALMAQPPSEILKPYKVSILPQPDIFGEVTLSLAWHKDSLLEDHMLKFILDSARGLSRKYVKV